MKNQYGKPYLIKGGIELYQNGELIRYEEYNGTLERLKIILDWKKLVIRISYRELFWIIIKPDIEIQD